MKNIEKHRKTSKNIEKHQKHRKSQGRKGTIFHYIDTHTTDDRRSSCGVTKALRPPTTDDRATQRNNTSNIKQRVQFFESKSKSPVGLRIRDFSNATNAIRKRRVLFTAEKTANTFAKTNGTESSSGKHAKTGKTAAVAKSKKSVSAKPKKTPSSQPCPPKNPENPENQSQNTHPSGRNENSQEETSRKEAGRNVEVEQSTMSAEAKNQWRKEGLNASKDTIGESQIYESPEEEKSQTEKAQEETESQKEGSLIPDRVRTGELTGRVNSDLTSESELGGKDSTSNDLIQPCHDLIQPAMNTEDSDGTVVQHSDGTTSTLMGQSSSTLMGQHSDGAVVQQEGSDRPESSESPARSNDDNVGRERPEEVGGFTAENCGEKLGLLNAESEVLRESDIEKDVLENDICIGFAQPFRSELPKNRLLSALHRGAEASSRTETMKTTGSSLHEHRTNDEKVWEFYGPPPTTKGNSNCNSTTLNLVNNFCNLNSNAASSLSSSCGSTCMKNRPKTLLNAVLEEEEEDCLSEENEISAERSSLKVTPLMIPEETLEELQALGDLSCCGFVSDDDGTFVSEDEEDLRRTILPVNKIETGRIKKNQKKSKKIEKKSKTNRKKSKKIKKKSKKNQKKIKKKIKKNKNKSKKIKKKSKKIKKNQKKNKKK